MRIQKIIKIIIFLLTLPSLTLSLLSCDSENELMENNEGGVLDKNGDLKINIANLKGTWRHCDKTSDIRYITDEGSWSYEIIKTHEGVFFQTGSYTLSGSHYTETNTDIYTNKKYTDEYDLSFNKDTLIFTHYSSGKAYKNKFVKTSSTVPVERLKTPYESYLCYYDVYYPLRIVEMNMSHSSIGSTEGNFKFLTFRSQSREIYPASLSFGYCTPYYDGIDNKWPDGKYNVNEKSSYYNYYPVFCNAGNSSIKTYGGTLEIKTTGSIKTFNYNDPEGYVKVHFVGN